MDLLNHPERWQRVKSLMLLWQEVLTECGHLCHTSTTRDAQTARERSNAEGLSFFTITLPNFASDFERCLDEGRLTPDSFDGFRRRKGLPVFLQGFLELVFDRKNGVLLPKSFQRYDAIFAVRQITRLFGKIEMQCADKRIRKAILGYLETEQQVASMDEEMMTSHLARFHRISSLLYSTILSTVELQLDSGQYVPKHGPGATADGLRGNAKNRQHQWTTRLESVFPMEYNLLPSPSYWRELDRVDLLDPEHELPVEVTLVPKTLKAPRIIAMEPTCMQYMQQAVAELLVNGIESHKLLSHFIGFSDQIPNREMARIGSETGALATLDLSEASDRVSNVHVVEMFRNYSTLNDGVQACRSTKALVPDHGVIPLAKFASMGSALTFPIEAMVFLTVVFAGIEKELERPLTPKDLISFRGKVRVYGDDIIVPVEYVSAVVRELETFGYRVNSGKSFWTGRFRESCGKEYFEGLDVSIVKVRQVLPTRQTDVKEIVSTVSLRNQFYWLGLWQTAAYLDRLLGRLIKLPKIGPDSPLLGRNTVMQVSADGFCADLHVPVVKGWVVSSQLPSNSLDDYYALLKWFLKRGDEPFADVNHLERSGRPKRVDIKLRWASSL